MSDRVGEATTYFENSTHKTIYYQPRVFYIPQSSRVETRASCEFLNRNIHPFFCAASDLVGLTWPEQLLWVWLAQSWEDRQSPEEAWLGQGWSEGTRVIAIWEPGEGGACIEELPDWAPRISQPPPGLAGAARPLSSPPPTPPSAAPVTSHSLLTSALSPDSWTPCLTRLCCHS